MVEVEDAVEDAAQLAQLKALPSKIVLPAMHQNEE